MVELVRDPYGALAHRDVDRAVADGEGRRVGVRPWPGIEIRVTVSSSKFATHSVSVPTAMATGDCPTVISRCFWFVSGSTSTTEFAARFTIHSEPSPNATSENSGSTELDDVSRPASSPIDVATPVRALIRPTSPTSQTNHTDPPPKAALARGAPQGVLPPRAEIGLAARSAPG